ncbi:nucleotide-binding protein [Nostoc sp. WHI]|uniref:nucleotide-binding protein n=1 Tax=Nostoc sp. WHI TaxID=2650611 RepID=UPI0018C576AF|nr:hypothetical protein [Nostoc sp. WHI]
MTDIINSTENTNAEDPNQEELEKQEITQVYPHRLVIVTGDKGGVGKSTFARGLVQTYLDNNKTFIGFDADSSNSQLLRFYGHFCHIEPLDIFRKGKIDQFFDRLKNITNPEADQYGHPPQPESLILLELPPQSRRILQKFMEEMNFLEIAQKDYGVRVTMVVVISRVIDSINQLIDLYSFCGNQADYVVVKNLFFGESDEFTRYEKSPKIQAIKDELKSEKIPFVDITMPELISHAYDYIDENSITFQQGSEQKDIPSVRARVISWLGTFKKEIRPVKMLLGLDDVEL